uniref:Uncharacterized protein n=1 Tax=Anguilla anguilla TaxID=7936 RepID=A0A0E9T6M3_ANGAN
MKRNTTLYWGHIASGLKMFY